MGDNNFFTFFDNLDKIVYKKLKTFSENFFIKIFSFIGNIWFCFAYLLFVIFIDKKIFYISLFSLLLSTIIVAVLKFTIRRDRIKKDNKNFFLKKIDPYSFPSGHVSRLSSLAFALKENEVLFFIFLFFTIITALARISKGYHYFSDCVFAFIIGVISGIFSNIYLKIFIKIIEKIFF